ncbi:hypothetical protein IWQ62_006769, partial [Dispira parvispora]
MAAAARKMSKSSPSPNPTTYLAPNVGGSGVIRWPEFDEDDVVTFLEEFEEIAEAHGIQGKRRCVKLKYCLPKEKVEEVTLYEGYLSGDWEQLKKDLLYVFPQTGTSSKRLEKKLKELIRYRWTMDGLRSKVLMYQSLIRATKGGGMTNDMQGKLLIRLLPVNLERKLKDNSVVDGEMPPLAEVAKKVLAHAANEEYWAEEEIIPGVEETPNVEPKPAPKSDPKSEPKPDQKPEINLLAEQFEKLSLNLIRMVEDRTKGGYRDRDNWTRNCFYCNSPGHRKYDCAEYAKDKLDGLFTIGERGKIFDRQGNFVRIDAEKGMMHHIRNQRGKTNLVRGVSISPEAATFAVKSVPEEVIEVPTEWDCPVVIDGVTYQVKRP